jgi:hypothetical protein
VSQHLTVTLVTPSCAYVTGFGSRDLLTELRGRPPVYATRVRAWVTTPTVARDLVAIAEHRGYDVTVESGDER